MLRLVVLVAALIAIFVYVAFPAALFWAAIPGLLLFTWLFEAGRRGRRLLAKRKKYDAMDEASRLAAGMIIFHGVWLGLTSGQAGAEPMSGEGMVNVDPGFSGFDGDMGGGGDGGGGGGGGF